MKAIDLLNKFADLNIPTIARNIVEQAVRELNEGNEKPLQVTELEFYLVAKFAEVTPNETHGTKWFRIFDEQGNGKDIQIYNAWKA